MQPTITQSLSALLASFPAADSSDPESTARAFMMAIEGVPPQFVAAAVKRFIRGEVQRDKHTFLPSTAELAIEARRIEKQADIEARIAARAALPKPQEPERKPPTAEEREKVAALFEGLANGMKGQKKVQAELMQSAERIRGDQREPISIEGVTLSPAALSRVGVSTRTEETSQERTNG